MAKPGHSTGGREIEARSDPRERAPDDLGLYPDNDPKKS